MNHRYQFFLFTEFQFVDARGELFANEFDAAGLLSTLLNKLKDRGYVNVMLTNHQKSLTAGLASALLYMLVGDGVDLSSVEFISDSSEVVKYVSALTNVTSRVGSIAEAEQARMLSEKKANKQIVEPSDVLSDKLAAEFNATFGSKNSTGEVSDEEELEHGFD